MGRRRSVRIKVASRKKPKLSSNKGGFLTAKVATIRKKNMNEKGHG